MVIEESQAGFCSYSGTLASTHGGFTGSGYVDSSNQTGVGLVWALNAPAAGTYVISLRFANAGGQARPAQLKTATGEFANYSFELTGAWTDWQSQSRSIYLEAGNNLLSLEAQTADGLANIDSLTSAGLRPGQCPSTPVSSERYPSHNANEVNPDSRLRITFDNTPSIQSGEVQIFDAATNSLVDSLNVQKDTDTLGYSGQANARVLNRVPVQVVGNSILISPHSNRLQYGKRYSVVIGNGVFNGTLAGRSFTGFSAGQWQFATKASGPSGASISVDDEGAADFGSIQGALNYVMKNLPGSTAATINVRNGTYPEPLYLRDKSNLRILGESRDGTLVRFANYEGLNSGTNGRPLFLIQGGDLISLENITLFNTHQRAFAASGSQAEALYFGSDTGRFIAKNAAFISEQDTVQLRGYSWFYNSLIAGNVDFIWGSARVALFENSELRSLGDSQGGGSSTSGGYVLQARVTSTSYPGFVFLNSKFTRAPGPAGNNIGSGRTYLARSGFSSGANNLDSFAFINCAMDAHIAPVGWFSESGKTRNPLKGTASYGFREYGTVNLSGARVDLSSRDGAYILSQAEYNQGYASRSQLFASFNNGQGWNPQP